MPEPDEQRRPEPPLWEQWAEQSRALPQGERLQKVLATRGWGSRRVCEDLIAAGRVTVDGVVAVLGTRADPDAQRIEVDGEPIRLQPEDVTVVLHKPTGIVVTAIDDRGRTTVFDILADPPPHLRYVGRLDRDTSGLLILTTDGELAHRLTHPRYEVLKTYEATVDGVVAEAALERLRERAAKVESVEGRGVIDGDTVTVDLERYTWEDGGKAAEGEADRPAPDAGAAGVSKDSHSGVEIEIGAKANPPGFDAQLLGLEPGASKTFPVRYPQDYPIGELAATSVSYSVTVKGLKRRVLPALDDEFAKDMGEFETLDALRARVRADLEHEAKHASDRELRGELMKQLATRVPFDIPESLVERELERRALRQRQRRRSLLVSSTAVVVVFGLLVAGAMAGVILVAMGLARLGRLMQFVPHPVTTGFTAGIALVIDGAIQHAPHPNRHSITPPRA